MFSNIAFIIGLALMFLYTLVYFGARLLGKEYTASKEMHLAPFMWFAAAIVAHVLKW